MKKSLIFAIMSILIASVSITSISAQPQYDIPSWVKGMAGFWVEGKISDSEFGEGLTFLIDSNIIKVPKIQELENKIVQLENENKQLISKTNDNPEEEILDSEHSHASILLKIFGDEFDFSSSPYQIKSSDVHFEGNDGTTIHKHATGVTFGYLFDTLSLGIDEKCFTFQDGRSFCTNEDYSLNFFVNGEQTVDIRDLEISDNGKILISYGEGTQNEINQQLTELNNQEIIR